MHETIQHYLKLNKKHNVKNKATPKTKRNGYMEYMKLNTKKFYSINPNKAKKSKNQ